MKEKENTNKVSKIPELNNRILDLVHTRSSGNVSEFARIIDQDQQKIERLFRVDKRNNKYPKPSDPIIEAIIQKLGISREWLLLGIGFEEENNYKGNIKSNNNELQHLKNEIIALKNQIKKLEDARNKQTSQIIEVIAKERTAIMDVLQKVLKHHNK